MSILKIEDIGDQVEVVVWFRHGKVLPLRFRWRGRTYKVQSINGDWRSEIGSDHYRHFAVASDTPDVYELSYNEASGIWKLEKVAMNG